MKILLLSTGGNIGGEETFTRNLAVGLSKRGHQVEVAVGGPVQQNDLVNAGIKIADVDIIGRSVFSLIRNARTLARYIKENQFDIVHAQAVGPAIMGVISKRIYGCPVPWIWHNHGITDFSYHYIVRHLNRLDRIVANSDYVREMLKSHGVKRQKIERIHNGIDINIFTATMQERMEARQSILDEFSLRDSSKIITYVGRLSPEKGVDVLLSAFRILAEKMDNVVCMLVGDGIQRSDLIRQIDSYTCRDRIVFAGFRKDIKRLMAGSDVFVLPSHIETFSLSVLQAFATKTPCVASDVGGTPEQILHRFNGLLFQDGQAENLFACLDEILNNETLWNYISNNASLLSRSYLNSDRMIDDIENLYNRLNTLKS